MLETRIATVADAALITAFRRATFAAMGIYGACGFRRTSEMLCVEPIEG